MESQITLKDIVELINRNQNITNDKFESVNDKFELITTLIKTNQEKTDKKFENLTELMVKSFDTVYEDIAHTKKEIRNVETNLGERISRLEYYTA
ncbi:hypothetical protein H0W32_01330, partial [Patescibacteria group bacterium]|nr:hypothetical protein [Patescibacteria group bacterium]